MLSAETRLNLLLNERDARRAEVFEGPLLLYEQFLLARGRDEVLTLQIAAVTVEISGVEEDE